MSTDVAPLEGRFRFPTIRDAAFGPGSVEALAEWLAAAEVSRVLLLSSKTLATQTGLTKRVEELIGDRLAGTFAEPRPHVPREVVLQAAEQARELRADGLVSFGGGSVSDLGRGVMLALAEGIHEESDFDRYVVELSQAGVNMPTMRGPALPHWIIPTTLSAGEWTWGIGITDRARRAKDVYVMEPMMAQGVVMDSELALATPLDLWTSTGVRAIDHCIESMCSRSAQPFVDALCADGLAALVANLPAAVERPDDVEPRTRSLIATWQSAFGFCNVWMGLSHAIGHQLGARFDVPHGITSCVILSHVMDYNRDYCPEALARIAGIFGVMATDQAEAAAAAPSALRDFLAHLGLPTKLRQIGIGRSEFGLIVDDVMADFVYLSNPRPVTSRDQVLEVLEAAL